MAPGVHDAALGEAFPFAKRPDLRLVGAGPGQTIVDGGGADVTLVSVSSTCPGVCASFDHDTLVAGRKLRSAARGVGVGSDSHDVATTLVDFEIEQKSSCGIATEGGGFGGAAPIDVVLRRVRVVGPVSVGLFL